MSKTSTVPQTRISRTSSILLSPSKKRRVRSDDEKRKDERDETTSHGDDKNIEQAASTPAEIFRWTFTRTAIASCFIQDVYEMRESGIKDMEFFWLGRIPCRTVRLVGLVVGVQVWEKRTMYTIDDGTAVVECAHAHPLTQPANPTKPKVSGAPMKQSTKTVGLSYTDYLPSARRAPQTSIATPKHAPHEPPVPPKPVARVGQCVQVVGRVVTRFDSRILLVDEISQCASFNDESNHSLSVFELHSTTYHPTISLPAFVPPPLPTNGTVATPNHPWSPSKRGAVLEPATPSSAHAISASTTTSPSTTATTTSPASSAGEERQVSDCTRSTLTAALTAQRVPRLRHPSRLHTRDLTANTFRIYVKHYMDNAPPPHRRCPSLARARSVSPSPMPRGSQSRSLETPTKAYDRSGVEATPRPTRLFSAQRVESTPRAPRLPDADSGDEDIEDRFDDDDQMYGYTLSHLRRVPELSTLARRVVKAEARRRAKEEHKKVTTQSSGKPGAAAARSSSQAIDGVAVKRLFKQVIRMLFQEGDIVLWNGPVRLLPLPTLGLMLPSSSILWKANSSIVSVASAASSRSQPSYEEWDEEEELSDPEPGEEAYVPLTPACFSRVLEDAIGKIMAEACAPSGEATPKPAAKSLIERLRAEKKTGPRVGPTKTELLAWLRNSDERWERVGEWTVEEALEWGKREGRLWCVGRGRWELCG